VIPPCLRPWLLVVAACNSGPTFGAPVPFGVDASVNADGGGAGDVVVVDTPAEAIADGPEGQPEAHADADAPDGSASCDFCYADQYCLGGRCTDKPEPVRPVFPACAHPPCINVLNNCPIPLWTHAVATVPLDGGNVRRLQPGQSFQYAGLPLFGGGRLYAYYQEPANKQDPVRLVSDHNQFVEMTVDTDAAGAFAQNYNISYVDYAALPVLMKAQGACPDTRCGMPFDDWRDMQRRCPTDVRNLDQGLGTCTGSYIYCLGANDDAQPYCRKMREAHGFAGSAIYGGVFPDHPATDVAFWDGVAAWNRGTTPGDPDDTRYYQREPFNHYARFIHRDLGCHKVYAFSTDDHQDQAGFVRCTSPALDVIWCPYDRPSAVVP
jgi:hypothetical protein